MIKKIFLDMDGVLCDMDGRLFERFGYNWLTKPSDAEWRADFRTFIDEGHFATLDFLEGATALIQCVDQINVTKCILSSTAHPSLHIPVFAQKYHWLDWRNIQYPRYLVPGRRLKQAFAEPGYVLIDDIEHNINQWREAGGIGILHTSAKETINELNYLITGH